MRAIPPVPLVLIALIALMQYPLWLGKGSWLKVWELDRLAKSQRETNDTLQKRNSALEAEVRDLKQGLEAIEERARYQLGMIRQDEVFFRLVDGDGAAKGVPAGH
jgi:cell division protein FtsB